MPNLDSFLTPPSELLAVHLMWVDTEKLSLYLLCYETQNFLAWVVSPGSHGGVSLGPLSLLLTAYLENLAKEAVTIRGESHSLFCPHEFK